MTLDDLNSYISFNKKLVGFLIEHQSQVKILYSPTKSPTYLNQPQQFFMFGSKHDRTEVILFQHQLNHPNFEEYYVNKRKPKRLEVEYSSCRKSSSITRCL
jgi:hypothetical protein